MTLRRASWAILTPAFTTYIDGGGELVLAWRPDRDCELVPCVIFGDHRFELEPGSMIVPAEPRRRPAE